MCPVWMPLFRHMKYHIEPYIVSIFLKIQQDGHPGFLLCDEFVEYLALSFHIDSPEFYEQYPPTRDGITRLLRDIETRILETYEGFVNLPHPDNRWLGKYPYRDVITLHRWFMPNEEVLPDYTKGKPICTARYEDIVKLYDVYQKDYGNVVRFIGEQSKYRVSIADIWDENIEDENVPCDAHISGGRIIRDIFLSKYGSTIGLFSSMGYETVENIRWDLEKNRGRVRPLIDYLEGDKPIVDQHNFTKRPSTINDCITLFGNRQVKYSAFKATHTHVTSTADLKLDLYGWIQLTYKPIMMGFSLYDVMVELANVDNGAGLINLTKFIETERAKGLVAFANGTTITGGGR